MGGLTSGNSVSIGQRPLNGFTPIIPPLSPLRPRWQTAQIDASAKSNLAPPTHAAASGSAPRASHTNPRLGARHMSQPPVAHRLQHRQQSPPTVGQVILIAAGPLLGRPRADQAACLQALETRREDVRGNPLRTRRKIPKARLAGEQIPDDQQRPLIAYEIQRRRDWTGRSSLRCASGAHTTPPEVPARIRSI